MTPQLITHSAVAICAPDKNSLSNSRILPSSLFWFNSLAWYYKKLVFFEIRQIGRRHRLSQQDDTNILPSMIIARRTIPCTPYTETRQEPNIKAVDSTNRSIDEVHNPNHHKIVKRRSTLRGQNQWCKLNIDVSSPRDRSSICTIDTTPESKSAEPSIASLSRTGKSFYERDSSTVKVRNGKKKAWLSKYNPFHKKQQNKQWFVRNHCPEASIDAFEMLFFEKETREFLSVRVPVP